MRLFLALWPDAGVRRQLVQAQAAWGWPAAAALVPAGRLHVTLHHLGEVGEAPLAALRAGLPPLPQPFELVLGQPALWPQGLAVLEPLALPAALATLHEALAGVLTRVGLSVDPRPFRPHVTLARHAQAVSLPVPAPPWRWPVRGYALVHSRSGPPLRYEVLQHVGG